MSVKSNGFEEYAAFACIAYTHDNETNTLVVEDLGNKNLNTFAPFIKRYAFQQKIAKISIKVNKSNAIYFFQHGFNVEATILSDHGLQDAFYIAYYLKDSYIENPFEEEHQAILDASFEATSFEATSFEATSFEITSFEINNKDSLTVDEPNIEVYCGLKNTSIDGKQPLVLTGRKSPLAHKNTTKYFFAEIENKIVAKVNADYCANKKMVEFSAFVVNLELEPQKVLNRLLTKMAGHYASLNCRTAYTIVPASSLMINSLCVEHKFSFGGRLTNESIFKGKLDSLNTWYKQL